MIICCLVTYISHGQGEIIFRNNSATLISTNTVHGGPATGPTSPVLGSWIYGLFVAAPTVTTVTGVDDTNWTGYGVYYATNTAAATGGRLSAGPSETTIQGLPPGSSANMIVRGWSSNIGYSWESVRNWYNNGIGAGQDVPVAGFFGQSTIGLNAVFNAWPAPWNNVFGNTGSSREVPGFLLNYFEPIPEPTVATIVLSGVALFWSMRQRHRHRPAE